MHYVVVGLVMFLFGMSAGAYFAGVSVKKLETTIGGMITKIDGTKSSVNALHNKVESIKAATTTAFPQK